MVQIEQEKGHGRGGKEGYPRQIDVLLGVEHTGIPPQEIQGSLDALASRRVYTPLEYRAARTVGQGFGYERVDC